MFKVFKKIISFFILLLFYFPKIKVYKELPQWIISSDRAAYNPGSNTIFIKRGEGLLTLCHELGHWFACIYDLPELHRWLDGSEINFK